MGAVDGGVELELALRDVAGRALVVGDLGQVEVVLAGGEIDVVVAGTAGRPGRIQIAVAWAAPVVCSWQNVQLRASAGKTTSEKSDTLF